MTYTEKTFAGTWYTINCTAPVTVFENIDGEQYELLILDRAGSDSFRAAGALVTIETDGKYRLLPFA